MKDILLYGLFEGCLAAWLLTLAWKWGVIEDLQTAPNKLLNKLGSCWYCLSWWTSVVVTALVVLVTMDWQLALSVFVSTMICKYLIDR